MQRTVVVNRVNARYVDNGDIIKSDNYTFYGKLSQRQLKNKVEKQQPERIYFEIKNETESILMVMDDETFYLNATKKQ